MPNRRVVASPNLWELGGAPDPLERTTMFTDTEIALDYLGKVGNHAALPPHLKAYLPEAPEEVSQDAATWLAESRGDDL